MIARLLRFAFALAAAVFLGCWADPAAPPTAQTASADYWLALPPSCAVDAADFDRLIDACETAIRRAHFRIDQTDRRRGLVTSLPEISAQPLELWRDDAPTLHDRAQAAISTVRRTIHVRIDRHDSTFTAAPRVVVERLSRDPDRPRERWIALRRDSEMEKRLCEAVRSRLAGPEPPARRS